MCHLLYNNVIFCNYNSTSRTKKQAWIYNKWQENTQDDIFGQNGWFLAFPVQQRNKSHVPCLCHGFAIILPCTSVRIEYDGKYKINKCKPQRLCFCGFFLCFLNFIRNCATTGTVSSTPASTRCQVTASGTNAVYWVCTKCGRKWKASINDRVQGKAECPTLKCHYIFSHFIK